MTFTHPTAIIGENVVLGDDCYIGPYCVLDGHVILGPGNRLISHVTISGRTRIGAGNIFYPFASIGHPPQDLKYQGEPSELIIGDQNIIREYVTIQPGTKGGGMVTIVGNRNLFMACSHVAHDCRVGNGNIFANSVALAGHVNVHDYVVFGGFTGVHQFVQIGSFAFTAGGSMIRQDVPPFVSVQGDSARAYGINSVGLRRHGFCQEEIQLAKRIFRVFFLSSAGLDERLAQIEELANQYPPENRTLAELFVNFVKNSTRGIVKNAMEKNDLSE